MKKAIIYLRVSTEEQAEKGFSIPAQRDECIKKAQELGCDNIIEYVDEGVSGSIMERPMLMNAIETLKNEKIDFFVSYDSSRLSRNVSHQLILIDTIKKNGAQLIFVRTNYEDTAEGRFQITIMAAVDEYERARLKIRTELGKRAKAKQKLLTHNPSLYGYYFDKTNDILIINEAQARVVKMIYNWLLEKKIGPAEIARKLNDMQILSLRGKEWSRVSINRILNNFSYTGTLFIRRYDTRDYKLNKYKKKGEKIKITERPKDQWVPISIPAIIDLDTWQMAKWQLDKAKRIYKKGTKDYYLLSGLLRCEVCGGTLFGRSTYKNGQLQNKYYCCINKYNYSKSKNERCKSKLYKADKLEKIIWNMSKSWILNENQIIKALDEKLRNKTKYTSENELKELIEQKGQEKQRILNLYQKGIVDEVEIVNRLKVIEENLESLTMDYERVLKIKNKEYTIKIDSLLSVMAAYLDNMDNLSKNKLLHIIIKEIIINDNMLRIKTLIPSYITEINLD